MGKGNKKAGSGGSANQAAATPDPEKVLTCAIAFEQNARRIHHEFVKSLRGRSAATAQATAGTTLNALLPMVVNSAFALELYLKCAHIVATGVMPFGHDLLALFKSLPTAVRMEVDRNYRGLLSARGVKRHVKGLTGPLDLHDIEAVLGYHRTSFVDFRYVFEHDDGIDFHSLDHITDAVKKAISAARPAWDRHHTSYVSPPDPSPQASATTPQK